MVDELSAHQAQGKSTRRRSAHYCALRRPPSHLTVLDAVACESTNLFAIGITAGEIA
jgi:hypothetical protein